MPVHQAVRIRVSIPDGIAGGSDLSTLAEINSEEREWLVQCPAVDDIAANYIFNSSTANGGSEALNKTQSMRVLPWSLLSISAQVEEDTVLIEIVIVNEIDELGSLGLLLNYSLALRGHFLGSDGRSLSQNVVHALFRSLG